MATAMAMALLPLRWRPLQHYTYPHNMPNWLELVLYQMADRGS
jgi:hypothetical protein